MDNFLNTIGGRITIFLIIIVGISAFYFMDNKKMEGDNLETKTVAVFETSKGSFEIDLYEGLAPKTIENFKKLVEEGFYDGVKFHRIIKGFMIQSGDPLSKDDDQMALWGTGGPGYTFEDEISEKNHNDKFTISMANAGPNTNGSQFFINTGDNNSLDTRHTVFGKVIEGMDVVEAIENVEVTQNMSGELSFPVEPVVIYSITLK